MATYYVATTGLDSNPGTQISPWLTPYKAWATAVAGDTVYFADGTYACNNGSFTTKHSGSVGNPITFRATNSRQVIWQAGSDHVIDLTNTTSYITFDGIVMRGNGTLKWLVYVEDATGLTLNDCEIYNTTNTCVDIVGACRSLNITDCTIHMDTYTNPLDGIVISGDGGVTGSISGCEIYNVYHVGIYISKGTANSFEIHDNIIHDTASHGIGFGDSTSMGVTTGGVVYNNVVYNIGQYHPYEFDKNFFFIQYTCSNITFHHNLCYVSSGHAINISRLSHCDNLLFYNNTFYDVDTAGWVTDSSCVNIYNDSVAESDIISVEFKNNIFYEATSSLDPIFCEYQTDVSNLFHFDYNDWYVPGFNPSNNVAWFTGQVAWSTWLGTTQEAHGIGTDPAFTNAAARDFTLLAGSPCIDAGLDVGYPYSGSAPDMGALEYTPPTATADFGDIPSDISIPALYSVRRNSADTAYEAYLPGAGSTGYTGYTGPGVGSTGYTGYTGRTGYTGYTGYTGAPAFDATNPATLSSTAVASPGASSIASRRDHVHAITNSSNPGAAASLLATDASGNTQVVGFKASGGVNVGSASSAPTGAIYLNGGAAGNRIVYGVNANHANDADTEALRLSSGADGTLGPTNLIVTMHPSATGGNRYADISVADNSTYRPIYLNRLGGAGVVIGSATGGNKGAGTLNVDGGLYVDGVPVTYPSMVIPIAMGGYTANVGISVDNWFGSAIGMACTITQIVWGYSIVAPNDGSNYWTVYMRRRDTGANLLSWNTSAKTAGTYYREATAYSIALTTSMLWIYIGFTKVGSPGNLIMVSPVFQTTA